MSYEIMSAEQLVDTIKERLQAAVLVTSHPLPVDLLQPYTLRQRLKVEPGIVRNWTLDLTGEDEPYRAMLVKIVEALASVRICPPGWPGSCAVTM